MEKTTPEMNRRCETLKCRDCGHYSHIACSRVSTQELYSLLLEYNELHADQPPYKSIEAVYKCLDCIIKGKSVNFLILESCLHYENIHFEFFILHEFHALLLRKRLQSFSEELERLGDANEHVIEHVQLV